MKIFQLQDQLGAQEGQEVRIWILHVNVPRGDLAAKGQQQGQKGTAKLNCATWAVSQMKCTKRTASPQACGQPEEMRSACGWPWLSYKCLEMIKHVSSQEGYLQQAALISVAAEETFHCCDWSPEMLGGWGRCVNHHSFLRAWYTSTLRHQPWHMLTLFSDKNLQLTL